MTTAAARTPGPSALPHANAGERPQLPSLTSLRYFAALFVLCFHYMWWEGIPSALRAFFECGYVGVSFFFVLSGFVLSYSYLDHDKRLTVRRRDFWTARFTRIYPAYLLALVVSVVAVYFREKSLRARSLYDILFHVTMTQAWAPLHALTWNYPGWSVSVEWFFYLAFPFVAVPLVRMKTRNAGLLLLVTWAAPLLLGAIWFGTALDGIDALIERDSAFWHNAVRFWPLVRLPEFLLGIYVGNLFNEDRARNLRRRGGLLALCAGSAACAIL